MEKAEETRRRIPHILEPPRVLLAIKDAPLEARCPEDISKHAKDETGVEVEFGAVGLTSGQIGSGHLVEPCMLKTEDELAPGVRELESIRRDILLYMGARGTAREIDVLLWYAEKIEDAIQTKEQLLEYQDMLQGSAQRLVDEGLLKVCKGASNPKRPEERMLMRVKHPMIRDTTRSSEKVVMGSKRGSRKRA